jgi:hypothetical protein
MPKRMTSKQKHIIIKTLAEGGTQRSAAKAAKVSQQSVSAKTSLIVESGIIKKEAHEAIKNEIIDDTKNTINGLEGIIKSCVSAITPDAILKQSAAANGLLLAQMIDKKQLLTGGATENINIAAGEKSKLIDIVMKKESANNKSNATIIIDNKPETGNIDVKLKFR